MEFPASSTPEEDAEARPLDASRVTSSGRERFLAVVLTVSGGDEEEGEVRDGARGGGRGDEEGGGEGGVG